ncbi:MAG TPA: 50S ribosomal protein L32e [Candidatus Nanoarchaeia archaeon]|nr:50S ribosomal protein L32e [Candidatus Nanoarchaeia archaeon]
MNKQNLLKVRRISKSKKPEFERQQANYKRRFEGQWRKPKGIQSKRRRAFRGHAKMPSIGYGSPAEIRGLTRTGYVPITVSNVNDLQNVKEGCAALISAVVGLKKRVTIINKAKEMKIKVLGVKDFDAYIKQAAEKVKLRKQSSQVRKEQQMKKLKESEKKDNKKEEKKTEEKSSEKTVNENDDKTKKKTTKKTGVENESKK